MGAGGIVRESTVWLWGNWVDRELCAAALLLLMQVEDRKV